MLVEWENVLLAEDDRSVKMLHALSGQLHDVDASFELLVVYNPEGSEGGAVERVIAEHFRPTGRHAGMPVRVEALEGAHYYAMRNRGAAMARGDVLLCLDSDVIPEAGWLKGVLTPILTNPEIRVIGGTTYIEPDTWFGRAFGSGWIFEPRDPDDSLRSGELHFWANNVAFRRRFFLETPYDENTENGETRNGDWRLRNRLRREGIPVWISTGARVSHPAPNGLRHTIVRGLGEGRDQAVMWSERGKSKPSQFFRAIDFAFGRVKRTWRHVTRRRADLRMPLHEVPVALLVMAGYSCLLVVGAWTRTLLPARFSMGWRF